MRWGTGDGLLIDDRYNARGTTRTLTNTTCSTCVKRCRDAECSWASRVTMADKRRLPGFDTRMKDLQRTSSGFTPLR